MQLRISLFLGLVIFATAHANLPEAQIASLPETSPQEAIHKAVLQWCIEDATLAQQSGLNAIVKERQQDISHLLGAPGNSNYAKERAVPGDLLPPIPDPDQNPVFKVSVSEVDRLLKADRRYPKGEAGGIIRDNAGDWVFVRRGEEALLLVQAFCHSQSPFNRDPRLVAPILRRFSAFCEYLVPGHKIVGDFGACSAIADAYLILRTCHPEIIPPNCRRDWEKRLVYNADYIYQNHRGDYLDNTKYGLVNADVKLVLSLALSARLFDRPEYAEVVSAGLSFIAKSILPDGATHYVNLQNECFSYHGIAVVSLMRISQIGNYPEALEMIKRMRWYYPLSLEPGGVAEWATASSWHHYWNAATGSDAAAIVASVTGCPYNQLIATSYPYKGSFWDATFYHPEIKSTPAPDRYITYDQNVEGPRGRFGLWSFVGTTRNFGDAERRGKSTYASAMILSGTGKKWPLDSALQDASSEVLMSPQQATDEIKGRVNLSQLEKNASTVSERFAAISTSHRLSSYGATPANWAQHEEWLFTPERLVGLVALEAIGEQKAYGLAGTLKLISGRGSSGVRKTFETIAPDTLKYGQMIVKFHSHDYEKMGTSYVSTFNDSAQKAGRIWLFDSHAAQTSTELCNYSAGSRHYYLVEIRPEWCPPADSVTLPNFGEGLAGIAVQEKNRKYLLIHNRTNAPRKYIAEQPAGSAKITLHPSGENFRATWLPPISAPVKSEAVPPGIRSFTIPAYQQIVLEYE